MKTYEGMDVWVHVFLILALVGGVWSASRPCHFTPGETTPSTLWKGGWVNPVWTTWRSEKFLTLQGLELWPLCRPAYSQLLYWLRYYGSIKPTTKHDIQSFPSITNPNKSFTYFLCYDRKKFTPTVQHKSRVFHSVAITGWRQCFTESSSGIQYTWLILMKQFTTHKSCNKKAEHSYFSI
jgi:hypothetical protein